MRDGGAFSTPCSATQSGARTASGQHAAVRVWVSAGKETDILREVEWVGQECAWDFVKTVRIETDPPPPPPPPPHTNRVSDGYLKVVEVIGCSVAHCWQRPEPVGLYV